jgi:hypothetical protein
MRQIDFDRTNPLTTPTADTGNNAALFAKTEVFVFKAEAQTGGAIRAKIMPACDQPMIAKEAVIPDPLSLALATQGSFIDNIVTGAGRTGGGAGTAR